MKDFTTRYPWGDNKRLALCMESEKTETGGMGKIWKSCRWTIDGEPRKDSSGWFIKVGSWGMNLWFHVALMPTEKATLANIRRKISRSARGRLVFSYENI